MVVECLATALNCKLCGKILVLRASGADDVSESCLSQIYLEIQKRPVLQ
jgi:ribosomal protein S27E